MAVTCGPIVTLAYECVPGCPNNCTTTAVASGPIITSTNECVPGCPNNCTTHCWARTFCGNWPMCIVAKVWSLVVREPSALPAGWLRERTECNSAEKNVQECKQKCVSSLRYASHQPRRQSPELPPGSIGAVGGLCGQPCPTRLRRCHFNAH